MINILEVQKRNTYCNALNVPIYVSTVNDSISMTFSLEYTEKKTIFVFIYIEQCYGLGCLMPLSTLFQLYRSGQVYSWRKPEYPVKTTYLSQFSDNIDHITILNVKWLMAYAGIVDIGHCIHG